MAKTTEHSKEFISRLRSGTVRPPVKLIGIVKANEESEHSVMFSSRGCEDWVEIPEKAIAEIETLGIVPCKDHQHPRVRIELAQSDDPTISALSAVLAQVTSRRRSEPVLLQRSAVHSRPITLRRQPAPFGKRQYFRMDGGVCPDSYPDCVYDESCEYGCACCEGTLEVKRLKQPCL